MDTRFLESFVSVVEHGSIAEAARRLNLTPAAVAQRIHALEGDIGARLLTRSGRTVRATEAGAAILDRARHLLQDMRDLQSIASDETAGELRLGAVSTAISGLLPNVLAAMTERYPQIEIYILPGTSAELYNKVLSGDLDAALIAQPPFTIPKVCDWRVVRNEPLVALIPATKAYSDPHKALATEPFIRYDRSNWGGRLVEGYLRWAGIRPRDRFELDGLEAIAVLVDRGLGVSLVPDWAPPWPEGLSLTKLQVRNQSFTRRMGLLWTRASLRLRLVQALLDAVAASPAIGNGGTLKRPRPRAKAR
ncbi:MAG: LysR family transcriptional regulator [Xanthobacteraceae bacterium]|nr:LysR family transcriptional regulator [Xanthobacteraceae bacterium]